MKKTMIVLLFATSPILGCDKMDTQNKVSQTNSADNSEAVNQKTIPGQFYVGFKKGVSRPEAEAVLKNYNLDYAFEEKPVPPRLFSYEVGEKFLIKVAQDKVIYWRQELNKNSFVEDTVLRYNDKAIDVD